LSLGWLYGSSEDMAALQSVLSDQPNIPPDEGSFFVPSLYYLESHLHPFKSVVGFVQLHLQEAFT